jgi:FAD/FMN-containing dehydrogenase
MNLAEKMADIVGEANVSTAENQLLAYATDKSFQPAQKPGIIVSPDSVEQVQALLKIADEEKVPITPRSSSIGFYGEGLPVENGIILNLQRLNRILKIDPDNKRVQVEPGVTYAQLTEALKDYDLHLAGPLLPHPLKSVLTSSLERDPILITKPDCNETFETAAFVMADGSLIRTGSSVGEGITSGIYPDGFFPGTALYKGAQGTLAVAVWANIKLEWRPKIDKTVFIPFQRYEDLPEPLYRMLYKQLGRECCVLNKAAMAMIFGSALKMALPAFGVFLVLSGDTWLPEEKIAYQEEALETLQQQFGFRAADQWSFPNPDRAGFADFIRRPWADSSVYWKERAKGAFSDLFFYLTMDRIPAVSAAIEKAIDQYGFDRDNLAFYLQPVEFGRVAYACFTFCYDKNDTTELKRVQQLTRTAAELVKDEGVHFATPCSVWRDLAYQDAENVVKTLMMVKKAFDPNHILNPGRLCY